MRCATARDAARHAAQRGADEHYKGVALMLPVLPRARELLADKGYDADWFRQLSQSAKSPLHPLQVQ